MAKGKQVIGDPITLGDGTMVPISQAVTANGFLFIAGQLGVDENFAVVGETMSAQTTQALENLRAQLAAGGCGPEHVVKVNAWITDRSDFAIFNQVYAMMFSDAPPVRSTVISELLIPGAKVEIEAIAVLP